MQERLGEMRMLVYPKAGLGGGRVTDEAGGPGFSPYWGLFEWILVSWI